MQVIKKCPNCNKVVVIKPEIQEPSFLVKDFYNIVPGYSTTFKGFRYDDPRDDNNNPVSGESSARFEYEAPIELCGIRQIPLRHYKSNRWGYWGPADPNPSKRTSGWTDGKTTIRFFLNDPNDPNPPWNSNFIGSPYFKLYRLESLIQDDEKHLNESGPFWRTYADTNPGRENFYYPPYLVGVEKVPETGVATFVRLDTILGTIFTEDQQTICARHAINSSHYWYVRSQKLTDQDLINQFSPITSYYPDRPILVETYFESLGKGMYFREDWYLLQGVGIIGIAGASFPEGSATSWEYFDATFMKPGSNTFPHYQIIAQRNYIGEPLNITT